MKAYDVLFFLAIATTAWGQNETGNSVLLDIGHGQRFWQDTATVTDPDHLERLRYMSGEFKKTAASVDAGFGFAKEFTPGVLSRCKIVFIQTPSEQYTDAEIKALLDYLQGGGAMFLVMDVDYWSTLQQTNVNEIIKPFAIEYGGDVGDTLSGGYAKKNQVITKPLKIPAHGIRTVKGGTPIAFSKHGNIPLGVFKEIPKGGRLIVMGEGMVSLYMNEWEDVTDYQCQEFMRDAFMWLVRKKKKERN